MFIYKKITRFFDGIKYVEINYFEKTFFNIMGEGTSFFLSGTGRLHIFEINLLTDMKLLSQKDFRFLFLIFCQFENGFSFLVWAQVGISHGHFNSLMSHEFLDGK